MSHDSAERPIWPANDPWYRFTPRNLATGYLSLLAAGLVFASSLYTLLHETTDVKWTIFESGFGLVALLWIVTAANGLKSLKREQAIARRRSPN